MCRARLRPSAPTWWATLAASTAALVWTPGRMPAQDPPFVGIARTDAGTWRAIFHLTAPARALRFERSAQFYRERVWTVVTPGYRLARSGDWQVLEVMDGATPQSVIVAEFPEYTEPILKEYELFQPFSDGAVAIYTGHFYVRPSGPAYPERSAAIRTVRITPPPGASTIIRGRVHPGEVTWTDPRGDGTYAYLGTTRPIETADLVAIVDPGMPDWIAREFDAHLPRLFATYRERYGAALPWKPVVLYSFDDADQPGYSSGGGTLTGLIQMTLTGSAWRRPDAEAEERVFALLAHESAHLWNGQLVETPGDGESWMHEGGADYAANEMLLAFGVIDADRHRTNRAFSLNRCALGLADGPVHTAHRRGAFRVFYDCGVVMALWTEAALRRVRPSADFFGFWRDLIADARAHDGRYDEDRYFAVLATLGVADATVGRMRAFLSSDDGMEIAVRGLRAAGVSLRPGRGDPPAEIGQDLVRRALAHLMAQACNRTSFWSGTPFVTQALPGCAPFELAFEIYGMEGLRVRDQGASLYDAVAARCAAREAVSLNAENGTTIGTIPCSRPLPPRPAWYELGGT